MTILLEVSEITVPLSAGEFHNTRRTGAGYGLVRGCGKSHTESSRRPDTTGRKLGDLLMAAPIGGWRTAARADVTKQIAWWREPTKDQWCAYIAA